MGAADTSPLLALGQQRSPSLSLAGRCRAELGLLGLSRGVGPQRARAARELGGRRKSLATPPRCGVPSPVSVGGCLV